MTTVRRAIVMASLEQYIALTINVGVIAVMARLLTPDAVGHAVTGMAIAAIALSLREFVTPEFLIQRDDVTDTDLRTAVTMLFGVTVLLSGGVLVFSGEIGRFYSTGDLRGFLALVLASAFAEVVSMPITATLRRDMAFGTLANIRTAALLVSALTTIGMALLGFGYISYAWGIFANGMTLAFLCLFCAPFPLAWIYRPSLGAWRTVVEFGRFKGGSQAIDRAYESLPQLILGKVMSMSSVGLYSRANTICSIPDRIIMSAFYAMAFPALAASVREGRNIKQAYLQTLGYLSVLYWPGVMLIGLSAAPLVNLFLGPQWHEAVILVRILAFSSVFWFSSIVINPLLLALGQNRDAFLVSLLSRSVAAAIICIASMHGVVVMALSQFLSLPVQMLISLYFARKHLHFTPRELAAAITPSVQVTLLTLLGPLLLLQATDWRLEMGLPELVAMLLLALLGWLPGIILTKHVVLAEVRLLVALALNKVPRLYRRLMPKV